MKKGILFAAVFLLALNGGMSQNYSGKRLAVLPSNLKNVEDSELWLSGSVSDKLAANFKQYADFKIIDTANDAEIKKLQRKSESAAFDQTTAVEIGKRLSAQYVIFSTVTKNGAKYTLSGSFTDITTGESNPFSMPSRNSTDELYDIPGCAVDKATIELCGSLKIALSATALFVLEHGETGLSDDERLRIMDEAEKSFRNKIAELDAQLKALTASTSLSADAERQKIAAERALEEEKLNRARERILRLEEERKKKAEDAKKDAERDSELKRKRDEAAEEAEAMAQEVRKLQLANTAILSQIKVIEAKKKTLVEIRESTESRVEEAKADIQNQMDKDILEIENRPYDRVELVGGVPTEAAKERRKKETEEIKARLRKKMKEEETEIRNTTVKQETALLKSIHSDGKMISKKRTVTSLESESGVEYSIGIYDGSTASWHITMYISSDGIALAQQNFDLKYISVAPNPKISNPGELSELSRETYKAYSEDVDYYDSLFQRRAPILTFEVDYKVLMQPDDKPSQYEIEFLEIRIKETMTGKIVAAISPSQKTAEILMSPAYDLRTFAEQKVAAAKEEQKKIAAEKKERKKIERDEKYNDFPMDMRGFRCSASFNSDGFSGFDVEQLIAFSSRMFIGLNLGMMKTPDGIDYVISSKYMGKASFQLGFNTRLHFSFPPSLYVKGCVGALSGNTEKTWKNSSGEDRDTAVYLLLGSSAGIEIPLKKSLAVFGQMDFTYVYDAGTALSGSAGIKFRLFG